MTREEIERMANKKDWSDFYGNARQAVNLAIEVHDAALEEAAQGERTQAGGQLENPNADWIRGLKIGESK